MPNKCTVVGCRSGYKKKKDEPEENVKQPVFSYPEDSELRRLWIRFVNRPDWMPKNTTEYAKNILNQNIW